MRFMKKVAGRGNLTLPRDIREAMDIGEGDIIEFEVIGVVRKESTPVAPATPNDPAATVS